MIHSITHRFTSYPSLYVTKSGELWQQGFTSAGRNYGFRKLEEKLHQGQLKFIINGSWVSKRKLNECAYRVDEEIDNKRLQINNTPF